MSTLKTWMVGFGSERVPGGVTEDGENWFYTAYFVELTNEYGERFYWNHAIANEDEAAQIEAFAEYEILRSIFANPFESSNWRQGDDVYGSSAYAANWQENECARMDDDERAACRF